MEALDKSSPRNISSHYLCVFKGELLIGIAVLQRVQMYADDIFRKTSNNRLKQIAKQLIAKIVRGNTIVVGNLMHTGQHGVFFLMEEITQDSFLELVYKAIEELRNTIKKEFNKNTRIIVFKDYFDRDPIHKSHDFFERKKLYKAQVQPNMLFNIPNNWEAEQDYIIAFKKKYRDRFKRARKKSHVLKLIELDLDTIKMQSNALYSLYENVSNNARVNSFKLSQNHFYTLKEHLKENFKLYGYYLNQELIGFYTLILNEETLETYFLGYKKELQHEYQLYLNMLYNMVSFGIENKFKTIVFARTAMEIKSSIGAKPHKMHIYLKHTNNFLANTILKLIVKHMNPMREWQERHPFK